jgi:hypothetical protein
VEEKRRQAAALQMEVGLHFAGLNNSLR